MPIINKFSRKLSLALPIIAISMAANAEIALDANNGVSYTGAKGSVLSITSDGTASVNGVEVKKCDGASAKSFSSKLGSVTCEDTYVVLKDKHGNTLSRFSSYAMATDAKGNTERKLYDNSLAKLGSPTSGAAVLSQTQSTVVQETKTVTTEKLAAPAGYLNRPRIQAPKVDETTYTPKLGVMAQKTPSITKENTPADTRNDHAIAKVEKEARRAPAGSTVPMPPVNQAPVVIQTEATPPVVQTQTVTKVEVPTPSAVRAGEQPKTVTQTQTTAVPATTTTTNIITTNPEPSAAAAVVDDKKADY